MQPRRVVSMATLVVVLVWVGLAPTAASTRVPNESLGGRVLSTDAEPSPSLDPATAHLTLFPSDLLTAPPDPLELIPVVAAQAAVSSVVGPQGGELSAIGPDGTTYSLSIPPDALPVATTITLSPLSDVTGFPFDSQPEHRIGVTLAPSGLRFALPVSLTIDPASDLPDAGVATLGYRGDGHDASVELASQESGRLELAIEHFSGYVATWPIREPEWRALARRRLEHKESWIRHIMATWIGFRQQQTALGDDPRRYASDVDFARIWLKEYVDEVLRPRIEAAATGCREGEDAIAYWLGYWRQVQTLGVAGDADTLGDPDFYVTVNGVTSTHVFDFPQSLLPTVVENCFREDYERCAATGDFFLLYRRMFGFERTFQLLGQELQPAWIDLVVGYLQRCGHWEFDVATRFKVAEPRIAGVRSCCAPSGEIRRTIPLEWTAGRGTGLARLYGAKIEGKGDLTIDRLTFQGGPCRVTRTRPRQERQAQAALRRLEWEYPDDPAAPDWAASGYPVVVEMSLDLGSASTEYTAKCPPGRPVTFPLPFDDGQVGPIMTLSGDAVADRDEPERFPLSFRTGWTFPSANPFRAELTREGGMFNGVSRTTGRIEMTLRHMPR